MPPLEIPTERVAPKGTRLTLALHAVKPIGHGVRIAYANERHKHLVEGGAVAFYNLTFMRGKQRGEVEISTDDDTLDAEIDALGVLVVMTGADGDAIDMTVAGKTPAALDEEAAAAAIVEAAQKHGLPVGDASYSTENGVTSYVSSENGAPRWRARIGIYTRRIWFLPPVP